MADGVIGGYIAVERIKAEVAKSSVSGLEHTGRETNVDMPVQKGKILAFGDEVKGLEVGNVLYFHKARTHDMVTKKWGIVTMVPIGSAIYWEVD